MLLLFSILSATVSAGQPFTVSAEDVYYDNDKGIIYVEVSGVDAGVDEPGVVYIKDADRAGLTFGILVGDYTSPKDNVLAFPVTETLYAGEVGTTSEASLSIAPSSDTEIIGVLLETDDEDVPATNGDGLFVSLGTSTWGGRVGGRLVQDGDGDISLWYGDDLTQTTLMVGGAAHGICSGKGCTVASTAGDNYWGYRVVEGALYRFDIGEDCWYTFNGKSWVVAEEDADKLWVANAGHNVWYVADDATGELRKFDNVKDVWFNFVDGEWVKDIGEDCWLTAGSVVSSTVWMSPISSADLNTL